MFGPNMIARANVFGPLHGRVDSTKLGNTQPLERLSISHGVHREVRLAAHMSISALCCAIQRITCPLHREGVRQRHVHRT